MTTSILQKEKCRFRDIEFTPSGSGRRPTPGPLVHLASLSHRTRVSVENQEVTQPSCGCGIPQAGGEARWSQQERSMAEAGDQQQEGPSVQTMPVFLEPKGAPTWTPTCHF